MERRVFLKGLAASLAVAHSMPQIAAALTGYLQDLAADLASASEPEAYWRRVGEEFILRQGRIHFNCGSIGLTPRAVVEAHKAYIDRLEDDPYPFTWSGWDDAKSEEALTKARRFIGARENGEMLLTRNTTEAMNLIATGIQWETGDEVLTTDHEHAGGIYCWMHMQKMAGIRVKQIHLPTPVESKAQILQLIEDGITDRTRVVSVSHVNTTTGLRMPLADIAAITRPRGILLVADGAQVPGMLDVNVRDLGVDAYASSSHKWMLAPKGTGLLYIRGESGRYIKPISASTPNGSQHAVYMANGGTRNTPLMIAHGDAMDFHDVIGRDRVEARVLQLNRYLREKLRPMATLVPVTPEDPELSSALLSYIPQTRTVGSIYNQLHDWGISIKQTGYNAVYGDNAIEREGKKVIRLSTHIFNDEEQIDRLVRALGDATGTSTSISSGTGERPQAFDSGYNYPNPFNASTQIRYQLPAGTDVEVAIFNSKGQMLEVINSGFQEAGAHQLTWNATGQATGTYFYEVRAGAQRLARKMILLK
ncbi:MAG: aminotransferase class V-fold PLP-dependent enzyme [Gemmatimonadetes bacterium]|jgi:isopenicillin-N epimerase|nr:aminotransferase class V-fold PLP-dependent enzyme [Gemmatimonadota bacterium]MBT7863189.1 aminotransferase class V-fold PLP-dependent enzyme [Gemmatimonadota bacterium]